MRNANVTAVSVSSDELKINTNEAALRLKIPRGYENEDIKRCNLTLKSVLCCKYAYVRVPVEFKEAGICNLGFGDIESRDLCTALCGCQEAYILGVTIGIKADMLIKRLEIASPAEAFITDALASAAAESLCELADDMLRGVGKKPIRFSPGYGDLPLSVQPAVLAALNADYTLGIALSPSFLMTPMKSVTAIMGILPN